MFESTDTSRLPSKRQPATLLPAPLPERRHVTCQAPLPSPSSRRFPCRTPARGHPMVGAAGHEEPPVPRQARRRGHCLRPRTSRRLMMSAVCPFRTWPDLRDGYPLPLLCVEPSEVVRVHASSGTTGKRKILAYTQKDVDTFALQMARCYELAGLTTEDRMQIAVGYGLWTAGAGFQLAASASGRSPSRGPRQHRHAAPASCRSADHLYRLHLVNGPPPCRGSGAPQSARQDRT